MARNRIIYGTTRGDRLEGDDGDDRIYGQSGDDRIDGDDGDDYIEAGAGNDRIDGGDGEDIMFAGDGNDTVDGGDCDDVIDGGAGNDALEGGDGDDRIYGQSGDDRIGGDDGDDYIEAGAGNDRIDGGDRDDIVFAGDGNDAVDGGDCDDVIDGGTGHDALDGGDGNDVLFGGAGNDALDGNDGRDYLDGGSGINALDGGDDSDILFFRLADHVGEAVGNRSAYSTIDGGDDCDTFVLALTRAEWLRSDVQADVGRYLAFVEDGKRGSFTFTAFNLKIEDIENFVVAVDGSLLDPRDQSVSARADSVTVTEDATRVTLNLLANDQVPDLVKSVAVSAAAHGTVVLTQDYSDADRPVAQAVYTADAAYYQYLGAGEKATDTFTYTVTDADGDTSTATVTVVITGTNDAAVIGAPTNAVVREDIGVSSGKLVATGTIAISDVDRGQAYFVSHSGAPGNVGNLAFQPDGRYVYSVGNAAVQYLAAGQTRVDSFTVVARDGTSKAVQFTVTGTNDGPVASADGFGGTPAGGGWVLNSANGHYYRVITASTTQAEAVAKAQIDGGYLATITGASENEFIRNLLGGNSAWIDGARDAGGTFRLTQNGEAGTLAYANWQPGEPNNWNGYENYIAIDGGREGRWNDVNGVALGRVEEYNGAAINEDATFGFTAAQLLANDRDVDASDVLTVTGFAATTSRGATVTRVGDQFVYDPTRSANLQALALGQTAVDTFSYTIGDGRGGSSTATVSITVAGTNDAPVALPDSFSATEDAPIVTGSVATNDVDVDTGATRSFALNAPVAGLTLGSDGRYSFDAGNAAYQGLARGEQRAVVAAYTVTDQYGATATSTLTITLVGTNDAPVVTSTAADAAGAVREAGVATGGNAPDAGTPSAAGRLTSRDVDNGATATWSGSANGAYGSFAIGATGGWTYTLDNGRAATDALAAGETRTDTFLATVTDDKGATATRTVSILVTGANDAPMAVADTTTVSEDGIVTGSVAANDSDADTGATLSFALGAPVAGLTLNGDGSYSFDARHAAYQSLAQGETRAISVSYIVTDQFGASGTSVLMITMTGTNDAPVVTSAAAAAAGTVVEMGARPLLNPNVQTPGTPTTVGQLTSSDVDRGATAAWSGSANGTYGAFAIAADGKWTYTLDNGRTATNALKQGQSGTETFTAIVTDDRGATATQVVTVTVTGANDAPVLTSTAADARGAVREAGVLAGGNTPDAGVASATGRITASDIDGDTVVFWLGYTSNVYGTAAVAADGTWAYTLDNGRAATQALKAGETVTERFVVGYRDPQLAGWSQEVIVTVTGTNDAPIVVADVARATEDGAIVTGSVATNDSDVDRGDTLGFALDAPVAGLMLASDGSYRFDGSDAAYQSLAAGATRDVVTGYTATDAAGARSSAALTITVTGTNDGPVAGDDVLTATPSGEGWVLNPANGHYYRLIPTELNWADAAARAEADGGYLATIGNAAENGFVQTLLPGNGQQSWLGGYRDASGAFRWADGPEAGSFGYTSFAPGEPNDPVGEPALATFSWGQWNDIRASIALPSVQEFGGRTTNEDGMFRFTAAALLANDADIDAGDTFAITGFAATTAFGATVTRTGDQFGYDASGSTALQALARGESVTDSFAYTITDSNGATSAATVRLVVAGTNDRPTVTSATASGTVTEDGTTTATGTIAFADVDLADTHNVTVTAGGTGYVGALVATLADPSVGTGTGTVRWDFAVDNATIQALAQGQVLTQSYTVGVTDDKGATVDQVVTVTVTGTNDAPIARDDTLIAAPAGEGWILNVANGHYYRLVNTQLNWADADARAKVDGGYLATIGDAAENAFITSVLVTGTTWIGGYRDASGAFRWADGPEAGSFAYTNWAGGEPNNPITEQALAMYGSGTWNDLVADFALPSVQEAGGRPSDIATDENTVFGFDAGQLLGNDGDVDAGDTRTVTGFAAITAMGGTITRVGDQFTYDPRGSATLQALAQGATATDSFTYTITDSQGAISTATVRLGVVGTNAAPVVTGVVAGSATEGDKTVAIGALANASDPDGDVLTVVGLPNTLPAGVSYDAVTKVFTLDPTHAAYDSLAAGMTQVVTVSYGVSDGTVTTPASVRWTVTGTNDAPTARDDVLLGAPSAPSGAGWILNAANGHYYRRVDTALSWADADARAKADGGYLATIGDAAENAFVQSVQLFEYNWIGGYRDASGAFRWTDGPEAGTFAYTNWAPGEPNDPIGEKALLFFRSTAQWNDSIASIARTSVQEFGGRPSDAAVTDDNTTFSFTAGQLLANDIDIDAKDTRTITGFSATSALGATITRVGDQFTYDPRGSAALDALGQGARATDSFTYTITDSRGATSTATVRLGVASANDAPVAVADRANGTEDGAAITGSVAVNDTDADPGDLLRFALNAPVAGLTLANDGRYTFDTSNPAYQSLAAGATRDVVASYRVTDAKGATGNATLTITLTGTNDAPVARDDTLTAGPSGTGWVLNAANGHYYRQVTTLLSWADADARAKSDGGYLVTIGDAAENAFVRNLLLTEYNWIGGYRDASGAFRWTDGPEAGTFGYTNWAPGEPNDPVNEKALIFYRSTAQWNDSIAAIARSSVQEFGGRPSDATAIDEDTTFGFSAAKLLANDTDVDTGDTRTVTAFAATSALGATITRVGDQFTYDPRGSAALQALGRGATQTDSFTYTITDSQGATATATVRLVVAGANDGPVVDTGVSVLTGNVVEAGQADDRSIVAGTASATGTLVATADSGATLGWSGSASGAYGSFAVTAAGTWTYTLDNAKAATQALNEGQRVTETFTVTVTDNSGATATRPVVVTLDGTNDAPVVRDVAVAGNAPTTVGFVMGDTVVYALGDTDGDGRPDSVASSSALIQNTLGQAVADLDGDGDLDIVGSNITTFTTFTNVGDTNGDGRADFVTSTIGLNGFGGVSTKVAVGDLNGDGRADLAIIGGGHSLIEILNRGDSDGDGNADDFLVRQVEVGSGPGNVFGVVIADLNGDGRNDVISTSVGALPIIRFNLGDINDDGLLDYRVQTMTTGSQARNILAADFDGDSKLDLFGARNRTVHLNRGDSNGDGELEFVTVALSANSDPVDSQAIDIDSDGDIDVVGLNAGVKSVTIFYNRGDTNGDGVIDFTASTISTGALQPFNGIAAGDIDGDGDKDILFTGSPAGYLSNLGDTDGDSALDFAVVPLTGLPTGNWDAEFLVQPAVGLVGAVEDGPVLVGAFDGDDADADDTPRSLIYEILTQPVEGSVTNNGDGTFGFDPGDDFQNLGAGRTRNVSFTYRAVDAHGAASVPAMVTLTVTGTNDAPVVTGAVTGAATENGAPVGLAALANADDVDGDAILSVVGVPTTMPAGVSYNAVTRTFTLDPTNAAYDSLAAGALQVVTVSYGVSDGRTTTAASVSWTLTGTGGNNAPVVTGAVTGTAVEGEKTMSLGALANASDSDADTLTVVGLPTSLPAGVSYNAATKVFALDPANAAYNSLPAGTSQVVTVSYGVSDGTATTPASVAWTVTGTNDAPVVTGAVTRTVSENGLLSTVNPLANASDVDAGTTLTVLDVPAALPAGVRYDAADGRFVLTLGSETYQSLAEGESKVVTVNYMVGDGMAKAPASVSWTVNGANDAPVGVDATLSATENVGIEGRLTATDVDASDRTDRMTYRLAAPVTGLDLDSDGSYYFDARGGVYNPLALGETRDVVADIIVTDEHGASGTSTLTIRVTGANDAPVARPITMAVNEDQSVRLSFAGSDADAGAQLSYRILGSPAGVVTRPGQNAGLYFDASHAAYQSLSKGDQQSVVLDYEVTDEHGATARSTVTVVVAGAIDAPTVRETDVLQAEIGEAISGALSAATPDLKALFEYRAAEMRDLTGQVRDDFTVAEDGTFTIDVKAAAYAALAAGEKQLEKLYYEVATGRPDVVDRATATAALVVEVVGVNDAPVAVPDFASVVKDGNPMIGFVSDNDYDIDRRDSLTYTLAAPVAGLSFFPNGLYTFNPRDPAYQSIGPGEVRDVVATYIATDESGATATSTLTIQVTNGNALPVAGTLIAAANEDSFATGLLPVTDSGGGLLLFSLLGSAPPGLTLYANGSYILSANDAAYQSLAAGETSASFTQYRVVDAAGGMGFGLLQINVTGKNDAPVARPDNTVVSEDGVVLGQVFANDSDIDRGDTRTYALSAPVAGLTLRADGTYTFDARDPAYSSLRANEVRDRTAQYVVTDAAGASATATLTLKVTGTNDAPTADNLNFTGSFVEGTPTRLPVIGIADVDSANVVVTLTVDAPEQGFLVYNRPDWGSGGSGTVQVDLSTSSARISGSAAEVNQLLTGITFVPSDDVYGYVPITTTVSDGISTITGSALLYGEAASGARGASDQSLARDEAVEGASGHAVPDQAATPDYAELVFGYGDPADVDTRSVPTGSNRHGVLADATGGAADQSLPRDEAVEGAVGPVVPGQSGARDYAELVITHSGIVGVNAGNVVTGSNRPDILIGSAHDDILLGLGGSDTLTGGSGRDTFTFDRGSGIDTITDFVGGSAGDRIELRGSLGSLDQVRANAFDAADGTHIRLGDGDVLILVGYKLENLVAADFSFVL